MNDVMDRLVDELTGGWRDDVMNGLMDELTVAG